jgi:type I restriction enzyme M protein
MAEIEGGTPGMMDLLAELRRRLGMSQERLAGELGVSFPTVYRWEKGKTQPDALALQSIERFLKGLGPTYVDLREQFAQLRPTASPRRPRGRPNKRAAASSGEAGSILDIKSMENLLWKAACSIRGEKDAPKFKDYILPLLFIKRLSDVFEDELVRLVEQFADEATARNVLEADHSLVRFYLPTEATWPVLSRREAFEWPEGKRPRTLGEQVTTTIRAIAKANPSLQGVIDLVDFNETRNGEREISDEALSKVIELLSQPKHRLGLKDVEPDFLGRAYEYLLRKFAEGQGQSAGEFFTPMEVGWLLAYLMAPRQGEEVYDPCTGSGGLLIKCQLALKEREQSVARPLKLHGQELTGSSFAIGRMNMVVHDMEGEIARGNTMVNPKFLDGASLKRFDVVVTNPMWNQKTFEPSTYENDPYERFSVRGGFAPASSADWAWLQHVQASLKERGRAAVVIDTGAASRGSGNEGENREKVIRRWFVENDLIEAVILLPDNLFYNTTAAGLIIVLNNGKREDRKGKVLFLNASAEFQKGRPKNFLPEETVRRLAQIFHEGKEVEHLLKVVGVEEIAGNDFNLSPSRYVTSLAPTEHRDIQTLLDELAKHHGEAQALDHELKGIFTSLGYRWGGEA